MIPRILHQTWRDQQVPEKWHAYQRSWRANHPDWQYRLWTDADNRALVEAHYSWFLPIYDAYRAEISRVDAARYMIMHRFGGVYADLDMESLAPIDDLLDGEQVVLALEPSDHVDQSVLDEGLDHIVGNAFLASAPRHPFWLEVLGALVDAQLEPSPLDATGPFMLTRTIDRTTQRDELTVLPAERMSPAGKTDVWAADAEGVDLATRFADRAYMLHHWEGTWWRDGATGRNIQQIVDPNDRAPAHVSTDHLELPPPRVLILTPVRDAVTVLGRYAEKVRSLTYPSERITLALLEGDSRDGTYAACSALVAELGTELRRAATLQAGLPVPASGTAVGPEDPAPATERDRPRPQSSSAPRPRRRGLGAVARRRCVRLPVGHHRATARRAPRRDRSALRGRTRRRDVRPQHLSVHRGGAREVDWSRYVIDGVVTPPKGLARRYLDQLRGEQLVRVDCVGGTMLLVRADLHRDGLVFPHYPYALHIETEGLALMAHDMGHDCWAMPDVEIVHRY